MKIYFKTRLQARTFANKTGRKSPTTKNSLGKWSVNLKELKRGLRFGLNNEVVEDWDRLLD